MQLHYPDNKFFQKKYKAWLKTYTGPPLLSIEYKLVSFILMNSYYSEKTIKILTKVHWRHTELIKNVLEFKK